MIKHLLEFLGLYREPSQKDGWKVEDHRKKK